MKRPNLGDRRLGFDCLSMRRGGGTRDYNIVSKNAIGEAL